MPRLAVVLASGARMTDLATRCETFSFAEFTTTTTPCRGADGRLPPDCPGWCASADPPHGACPVPEPWHRPKADTVLGGRWRLLAPIGRGAMGVVFSAHDQVERRIVAVKLLGVDAEADGRARFFTEVKALERVRHPNVVRWIGSGVHRGHPYYAMDLVRGTTLAAVLDQRRDAFALLDALDLLVDVCAGVAAIHDAGVVHRDLKPSNILLDDRRRPVVADFGLAMPSGASCRLSPDEIVGTPAYMAPEVAARTAASATTAVDVYALGVLAFELLTGHRPFDGESWAEVMESQVHAEPPSARAWRPSLPAAVANVLALALAKDPARRPSGPMALCRALTVALGS